MVQYIPPNFVALLVDLVAHRMLAFLVLYHHQSVLVHGGGPIAGCWIASCCEESCCMDS